MNKIFKLIGILFVVSLLALTLTGCDGSSVLTLHVDEPSNDASVTAPTVMVKGSLGGTQVSSSKLTVNGADVSVKDSKFSTEVKLTEGKNVIKVVGATAAGFELKEELTVNYASSK